MFTIYNVQIYTSLQNWLHGKYENNTDLLRHCRGLTRARNVVKLVLNEVNYATEPRTCVEQPLQRARRSMHRRGTGEIAQ